MITREEFRWTLYINYYVIDKKTKKRVRYLKSVRFLEDSKEACKSRLSDFKKPTREIVSWTILDHLKGLFLYIKTE